MPGNTFGELFRVTTAGVSHGPGYLVIIDGCPPGLPLGVDDLLPDLRRRRPGQSKLVTQRKEDDVPEIWSGVFEGMHRRHLHRHPLPQHRPAQPATTATSRTSTAPATPTSPSTPSTASATTAAAAAPAPARPSAASPPGPSPRSCSPQHGVRVLGYVKQVGDVVADIPDPTAVTLEQVEATPVRCPDPAAAARMIALIEEVRKDQDSIGGVCELVASGVPAGLGEPVFDKLKADLAKALLSLPAVMAFEYGAGFARRHGARQRRTTTSSSPRCAERHRHGDQPPRRHARRHQQRRADRLPRGHQADQQPAAAAARR